MTSLYLSKLLGVDLSTITRLELSEAEDRISLSTLRRAAEALDCELVYALVPRQSLKETLESRANEIARQHMTAISHSMSLEAQATSPEMVETQQRELAESLLKGSRRALWQEPDNRE